MKRYGGDSDLGVAMGVWFLRYLTSILHTVFGLSFLGSSRKSVERGLDF